MSRGRWLNFKLYKAILISCVLAGCGGGGGGGGSQPRPEITRPPTETGSINRVEQQNSPGLFQVGANQVFINGATGRSDPHT